LAKKNKNFWSSDSKEKYDIASQKLLERLKKAPELTRIQLVNGSCLRKQTALRALNKLLEIGAVHRYGRGTRGNPYRYIVSSA